MGSWIGRSVFFTTRRKRARRSLLLYDDIYKRKTTQNLTNKLHLIIRLVFVNLRKQIANITTNYTYYRLIIEMSKIKHLYNEGSAVLRALHLAQRSAIQMRPGDPLLVIFRYPSNQQYFTMKINNRVLPNMAIAHVKFSYRLAALMGFDSEQTFGGTDTHRSRKKHDLVAGLSVVYVYCDLLEPILIGDTKAPLLRICNRPVQKTNKYRESYRAFNPIQYVPLQKKCFDTVTVQVMTDDGLVVPFLD